MAEEVKVARTDGGAVSDEIDWRRRTRGGERMSIACQAGRPVHAPSSSAGLVWRSSIEGVGSSDVYLESYTGLFPNSGVAYFCHGFLEDGVLVRQLWTEQEAGRKAAGLISVRTTRLDSRGDLVWTSTTHRTVELGDGQREEVEVIQVIRAKRIGGVELGLVGPTPKRVHTIELTPW